MSLLIAFLTFILVVTSLLLILLVLVQLPKKEAGAGLAFGGGASDALFGAGGGNALTKMTKYTATFFLALAFVLSLLNVQRHQSSSRSLQEELSKKQTAGSVVPPVTTPAPSGQQGAPSGSGPLQPQQNPSTGPLNLPANPPPAAQNTPAEAPAATPPQKSEPAAPDASQPQP